MIETYPLSPIQQGIVFESLVSSRAVYLQQHILRMQEDLSPLKLQEALQALATRHPILRSAIVPNQAGGYDQAVYETAVVPFQVFDLRGLDGQAQDEQVDLFLEQDRSQEFELSNAPLMRAALLSRGQSDHILVLTFHHAVIDARSYDLFTSELFSTYDGWMAGQEPRLEPPTPYRSYVEWLGQQDLTEAEIFWTGYLQGAGDPPQIELADMRFDPGESSTSSRDLPNEVAAILPEATAARLNRICAEENITLNTIFQAAWGLLIGRVCRRSDFTIGATRSCRRSALGGNTGTLMGPILNTVPLRLKIDPRQPLTEFLQGLRKAWVDMRPFENTPLNKIIEWSQAQRGQPLFNTICNFTNESPAAPGLPAEIARPSRMTELFQQLDYPLSASMASGKVTTIRLNFDTRRYDRRASANLLSQLVALLENISLHPECKIGELSLLTAAGREQVLYGWNPEAAPAAGLSAVWQLINTHAENQPDHLAVLEGWTDPQSGEARSITYRQLVERSNQFARFLASQEAGPETRIGICLERSIEFVLAFLGVLKSGAVYVALDPDLPPKRLAYMVAETGLKTVITHSRLVSRLPDTIENLLIIDQLEAPIAACSSAELDIWIDPENLAYIIYTSGSTGQPKGVMITQQGLSNLLDHFRLTYDLQPEDKMLMQTPISFDPSIYDPFCPLMYGSTLVLASPGRHADIDYIVDTTIRMGITIWHAVTSLASAMVEHPKAVQCSHVRLLMTGGESMPGDLPGKLAGRRAFQATNSYGPAENCIRSTSIFLPPDGRWPYNSVGKPIEHTKAYILDENMDPLPPGVIGEIYLGGSSLGRGYCSQPGMTAARFVPDPFGPPGGRLYRTGDLGRFHLDGQIEFLGRLDNQIKLRGVRIEIEEIERILDRHPMVKRSGVSLRQGNSGPYLAAVIQPMRLKKPDAKEIRTYLRQHLPENSIPAIIHTVWRLPLLPSGKIDRQALYEIGSEEQHLQGPSLPPSTATEILLARLFERTLSVEKVGLEDNFFSLGGHSLLVMRVIGKINEIFDIQLPLRALFEAPCVAELRDLLSAEAADPAQLEEIARYALERIDQQAVHRDVM